MKWFSPLIIVNFYNEQPAPLFVPTNGYDLSEVIDIVSTSWFHGFVSTQDAYKILINKLIGTYLCRFSTSTPGTYTLSVKHEVGVGHYKIQCKKVGLSAILFWIVSGQSFPSLHELTRFYTLTPLPTTSSAPPENNSPMRRLLTQSCDRMVEQCT